MTHRAPGPAVVHAIAPGSFGGAESVVAALAGAWRRQGGAGGVAALMAGGAGEPFVARLRSSGVSVWEVRGGTRGYAIEVRELRAILRREGADVLHTHGYRADAAGYLAARWGGAPVVATAHGFTAGDWKNRAYEWFDRRLLRRFDAVACVSPALVDRLRTVRRPERVRLVPNVPGAREALSRDAARRALDLPPDRAVVGWVGRLSPEKAPERFIAALAALDRDCVGVVVGDGPLRADLERLARGAAGDVRLVGARESAARLLAAFDLLVLSSRTEGTPMVLLEAMAAGVPVASFAVGGVPDVLEGAGWLVAPGDVAGMAAAITEALTAPDEAARRAERARARVNERYGEAQWVEAYADVYRLAMA